MTALPSAPNAGTWPAGGWALALLALAAPTLVAPHDPPSVTFYNQALAVLGWGLWLSWLGGRPAAAQHGPGRSALLALCGVLLTQAALALWAGVFSPVPLGLGLMGGGMALAAALAAWTGWRAGSVLLEAPLPGPLRGVPVYRSSRTPSRKVPASGA